MSLEQAKIAAAALPRAIEPRKGHPKTEIDAVNAIVDAQRHAQEAIDPAGAKRMIRSLVALGLLHFE